MELAPEGRWAETISAADPPGSRHSQSGGPFACEWTLVPRLLVTATKNNVLKRRCHKPSRHRGFGGRSPLMKEQKGGPEPYAQPLGCGRRPTLVPRLLVTATKNNVLKRRCHKPSRHRGFGGRSPLMKEQKGGPEPYARNPWVVGGGPPWRSVSNRVEYNRNPGWTDTRRDDERVAPPHRGIPNAAAAHPRQV